jgi:hypothetical protein
MAALLPPPAVFASAPGETSMTVSWEPTPVPDGVELLLELREFPADWARARSLPVPPAAHELRVTGLVPTATFEFRLRYRLADGSLGAPGPQATVDTLAAGCTPKNEAPPGQHKKDCAVQ